MNKVKQLLSRAINWLHFFWFKHFLDARAKIGETFSLVFLEIKRHHNCLLKFSDLYQRKLCYHNLLLLFGPIPLYHENFFVPDDRKSCCTQKITLFQLQAFWIIRSFEMLTININVTEHVYKKLANPTGAHQEYWHNGISKRHTLIVSKGFRQNHIYCLSFEV